MIFFIVVWVIWLILGMVGLAALLRMARLPSRAHWFIFFIAILLYAGAFAYGIAR